MKSLIETLLKQALNTLAITTDHPLQVERTRDEKHGDFASNIAMVLAKSLKKNPFEIAEQIVNALPKHELISKVEIARPGFINFYLDPKAYHQIVHTICDQKEKYGHSDIAKNKKCLLEFVSANPTGPLHVGHGRGAAYGASLANLLETIGFQVHREYYVNDAGRQMNILATSIWLRYLELLNENIIFPSNGYKGEYVIEIAKKLVADHQHQFHRPHVAIMHHLPLDNEENKDAHIDALIDRAKNLLNQDYEIIFQAGLNSILEDIRDDLHQFGVDYDQWFSEKSLQQNHDVEKVVQQLKDSDHLYEKDGAIWFRSTQFGDDKDRVVVRENGETTYFAADIAYHVNKYQRGFDKKINILGADHHGYVTRVNAALTALGYDTKKLDVLFVQFAILYRGQERVQMSTRSGSFVTLRELREEVGRDAARYFYVSRKCEQHMDFDLDLAKSQSSDNPIYYIQYAHARIASVFRQLAEKQMSFDLPQGLQHLSLLNSDHEKALINLLSRYPEMILLAAEHYEPHQLAHYLKDLANCFHAYYNSCIFLVEEEALRQARLTLCRATQYVFANGLTILGCSAPEKM